MKRKEHKIIQGIVTGDTNTIKDFYNKNYCYVKTFILKNRGTEKDAEDVFQDGLIFLYQKLQNETIHLDNSLNTFFYGVCKNIWRNRLRKKDRMVFNETLVQSYNLAESNQILQEIDDKERAHVYRKHFCNLKPENQKLMSHFFDGKSMKEIASLMGYSEGYTRKKKFRVKKELFTMIENDPLYNELAVSPSELAS